MRVILDVDEKIAVKATLNFKLEKVDWMNIWQKRAVFPKDSWIELINTFVIGRISLILLNKSFWDRKSVRSEINKK